MVFIGGPRQVGKTTLACSFLDVKNESDQAYLNWDYPKDRKRILSDAIPTHLPLLVFDEIHKYAKWRGLIKGYYDKFKSKMNIIVTGSARLDYYRKAGDSLQGRYHYYRLHPLSLGELQDFSNATFLRLLSLGGFPEPFFSDSETQARRWRLEYTQRFLKDDLRDLERIREVSLVELMIENLPEKVGSPLSIESLRKDLDVAHLTVARWLTILENLYFCFRLAPFGAPKIRAVKKEQKLYFWDWAQIPDESVRFENLVASQLLKHCHFLQDTKGHKMELRYLRDTDGRVVDFIVLKNKKPEFAVECKLSDRQLNPHIKYFKERLPEMKWFQVHANSEVDFETNGVRVLPFTSFCKDMQLS